MNKITIVDQVVKINLNPPSTSLKVKVAQYPIKIGVKLPSVTINNFYGENPTFVYIQSTPSNEWIINHNLEKYPLVAVYSAGMLEMEGSILHINKNQFRVYFSAPVTGVVLYS